MIADGNVWRSLSPAISSLGVVEVGCGHQSGSRACFGSVQSVWSRIAVESEGRGRLTAANGIVGDVVIVGESACGVRVSRSSMGCGVWWRRDEEQRWPSTLEH